MPLPCSRLAPAYLAPPLCSGAGTVQKRVQRRVPDPQSKGLTDLGESVPLGKGYARRARAPSTHRPAVRSSPSWNASNAMVAQPIPARLPKLNVGAEYAAMDLDPFVSIVTKELSDEMRDEVGEAWDGDVRRRNRRGTRRGAVDLKRKEGGSTNMVMSYNVKMKKIVKRGDLNSCLKLMEQMRARRLAPDKYTYSMALSCCARNDQVDMAIELYERMKSEAVPVDEYILTNLLTVAANASPPRMEICSHVFKSAQNPSLYMCNVLIDAFARVGRVSDCVAVYRYMSSRGLQGDKYTVSGMIKAYVECGKLDEAVKQIDDMYACGLDVSAVVFGQVMGAYGRRGQIEKAIQLFDSMTLYGVQPTQISYNILIGACANVSQMERAFEIYEEMKATSSFGGDRYTLHCLMKCCLSNMKGEKALELYRNIKRSNFPCNKVSYRLALIAAGQVMDLDAVLEVASDMVRYRYYAREDTMAMLVASAIRCSDLECALKFFSEYLTRQTEEERVVDFLNAIREGLKTFEFGAERNVGDSFHTMKVVDELERSWREGL